MTKELIISANVHEKKVSILEDGVVTEFYVERRDENQGVVGNLYKGRVMKVLPGMQSAFVDIGLERDAFLYVSDFTEFMEEEEEIDFRESGEEAKAAAQPPRPQDRTRRGGRFRPDAARPETPPAAVAAGEEEAPERPVAFDDAVEQLEEIILESGIAPPQEEPDEAVAIEAEEPGEAEVEGPLAAITEEEPGGEAETGEVDRLRGGRARRKPSEARLARKKPIRAEAAKRPVRRRGEEPAEEPLEEVAVLGGRPESLPEPFESGPQFERVTDEDLAQDAGDLLKDAILQEKFIEQVHEAEYQTSTPRREPEPEPEWRVGSFRSRLEDEKGFQRVVDESLEPPRPEEARAESDYPSSTARESEREDEPPVTPFKHFSDAVSPSLYDRARSWMFGKPGGEGPPLDEGESGWSGSDGESSARPAEPEESFERVSDAESAEEDREARIDDRSNRSEFAVRRGGRGRRRRPRDGQPAGATATGAEGSEESPEAAALAPVDGDIAAPVAEGETEIPAAEAPAPAPATPRRPGPFRDRRPPGRRPEPAPSRRPEGGGPPTISELLHEGQEILVQIAKEPIAKKGARITSHIALPGRLLVYMPTVNHIGVSRKIASEVERVRLKRVVTALRERESAGGGFIARTACAGHTEQELHDDMRYLLRTWADLRKKADRVKSPSLVHRDLDLVQRILRDQLSDEFTAIRVDNEIEYARIVEFVNRVQPKLVKRVKLYTGSQPILEKHSVQAEIDKAVRPRVWLRSGGYIVINQTEALVAIDVNTGKFVGKSDKLEDTITRTNLEAAKEIVRQVRLRDLGGIIVIDFIDKEERKNRQRVMMALQQELVSDRAPSKILSINDFGLVAITRKRVKQSLERTLCSPCPYCQGAGMVKSTQTMCFEILEQAKAMAKQVTGSEDVMLRVSPDVAQAFHTTERAVLEEVEAYFGTPITIEADPNLHQEQYDFAIV